MKRTNVLLAALVLVCMCTGTRAGTYTIQLNNWEGSYLAYTSASGPIDFGMQFSSIQSLTISWSGHIYAGYDEWDLPVTARFEADMVDGGIMATAHTNWSGYTLSRWNFNEVSPFAANTWDWLLDGKANSLFVTLVPETDEYEGDPFGQIYSAILTVTGEPVPEPAGIVVMAGGLVGVMGALRLRRK